MNSKKENESFEYSSEQEKLIKEFLDDVKKKLPFWLKDEPKNVLDILEELENHIWDRAYEIGETDNPSVVHVKEAISHMGSPSEIANEYKHRGKPKFFITEELFPMYLKAIIIIGSIILGINIISMLATIPRAVAGTITVGRLFSGFFSGLIISTSIALILISIQFIYLSREGYLPEDFKRMTQGKIPLEVFSIGKKEKPKRETTVSQDEVVPAKKAQIAEEKSVRIIHETPTQAVQPKHVKTQEYRAPRVAEKPRKEEVREPRARYYLGKDYLSEGIMGMVFGVVIIVLVFMPFLDFLPVAFKWWIVILGILGIALGFIRFIQALVGRMKYIQMGLMFISMVPQGLNIPLFYALLQRPEIAYDWIYSLVDHLITASTYNTIFVAVVWVIIGINILTLIAELVRIIKLGVEGFPRRY